MVYNMLLIGPPNRLSEIPRHNPDILAPGPPGGFPEGDAVRVVGEDEEVAFGGEPRMYTN